MSARCQLRSGAQHGERVDAGMPFETRVFGGDQHTAIERVDLIGLDRQAPFAVAAEKPAQDRPVCGEDKGRDVPSPMERWRR